jgi:5-methyltetrahydropteroyltriglutamate--homocysteine methyltransferase
MYTYAYGFPRLGKNREFKTYVERFWGGQITEEDLIANMNRIEEERLLTYRQYIDYFPLGEFTYYDNIFDTSLVFGVYKFRNLKEYFEYARGRKALELKKYFNTNYHYLVPHIPKDKRFKLAWNKPLFYFNTFSSFSDNPIFLIGPYTFLKLCRIEDDFGAAFGRLCEAYKDLFCQLFKRGVHSIHLEEPYFTLDVSNKEVKMIKEGFKALLKNKLKVNLITYYESINFLKELYQLPFYSIGLDFVAGQDNISILKRIGFPKERNLICGVVDGRGVRRSDIFQKARLLDCIRKITKLDPERVYLSNSAPLFSLPVTLENENFLKSSIRARLSFAKERLYELSLIKKVLLGNTQEAKEWCKGAKFKEFKERRKEFDTLSLKEKDFLKRRRTHSRILNLPLLPTTTIGSFPQDRELRKIRAKYRKRLISPKSYQHFIKEKIKNLIHFQERVNLDVLVHGEFERTDMVEFFAQQLKGFATTENGWIISYGTRVYRPPIIYDTIQRTRPLTLDQINYAQSLTSKPVKGIFTGPVTILAWSYNLVDVPLFRVAFDLAEALNQEARDLVRNNIKVIQIDEPAIREFSPLKKSKRSFYFSWAVRAFNLVARLPQRIQIHTHMCYSNFSDIIEWIKKMNFDVITIEAAREGAKIIDAFKDIKFLRQIGPGVWDIHSKLPADKKTIKEVLDKALEVFGKEKVWLNPDCGLKTRDWPEVEVSLKRIVRVAKEYRKKFLTAPKFTLKL